MNSETIIYIHEYLTEYFLDKEDPIRPPGIKDIGSIESASARPHATAGGGDAYPTVFLKAGALFHSISCNHAFYNGNKRTALLSTVYYLSEYGYWLDRCDDNEMYEFTRKIAAHEIDSDRRNEVPVIAEWLERNSRKQQKGDIPIKLGTLREILGKFGYDLYENGKTIHIKKEGEIVETVKKKGTRGLEEYDPQYISELRKRLNLTVEYGIDSARFYGQKGISESLNEFMQIRIEVMNRLAKT